MMCAAKLADWQRVGRIFFFLKMKIKQTCSGTAENEIHPVKHFFEGF